MSAWAQQIGGRTLLPEAFLTVGALAVASAIVFVLGLRLSRRWSVALLAAAVTIVMSPKLYNYPKVLMLALGVWALAEAIVSPSVLRLGALALVTVVAALFRHDFALYVGAAAVAALVARDAGDWKAAARTRRHLCGADARAGAAVDRLGAGLRRDSVVHRGSLASVAVERARTAVVPAGPSIWRRRSPARACCS